MPFRVTGAIKEPQRLRMVSAADRFGNLAERLRRVALGQGPTEQELASAPLLVGPRYVIRSAMCLVGWGEGHPRLPDGPVTTAGVIVDGSGLGWILTEGRYYRVSDIPIPMTDTLSNT
jgi:hypothetical protein